MDNWLPFALVLASRKKQQSTELAESLLVNNMPKGPRAVLTITQAVDRANLQAQQQKAVAQREAGLATLINDGKLTIVADISGDPRMQYMLQKISDPVLKESVARKLKGSDGGANDTVSRRGTHRAV